MTVSASPRRITTGPIRSEEHTSELQSRRDLVCRLLLEKKKKKTSRYSRAGKRVSFNSGSSSRFVPTATSNSVVNQRTSIFFFLMIRRPPRSTLFPLHDALPIWQGPRRYHPSALRSVPDLVEAAVRVGQPERTAEPLARFSDWARRVDVPTLEALAERCRALLEASEDAEEHYLTALKLHDGPFEQARTQLLYGAWLRRARRKSDARTQLRAAV